MTGHTKLGGPAIAQLRGIFIIILFIQRNIMPFSTETAFGEVFQQRPASVAFMREVTAEWVLGSIGANINPRSCYVNANVRWGSFCSAFAGLMEAEGHLQMAVDIIILI